MTRSYGSGTVRKRGRFWYVRASINGKRVERRTDARTRTEALAILAELKAGAAKGTLSAESLSVRVDELYEALCHDYETRDQRVADLAKRWKHLEPVFGRSRARDLTTPRLRMYVTERRNEGAAAATVQRELACLRRMLRIGVEDGRVTTLPAFPRVRADNARSGFVDAETFERLRSALPEPVATIAVLGYHLGWRKGELLALQWRNVDLDEGTVTLDAGTTKNREGRRAYLPAPAAEALRGWRRVSTEFERDSGRILPHVFHRDGRPVRSIEGAWRSACKTAGCPGLLFHDLRRTAARNYVRAGVPEGVAMKIMGHKTRTVFDRYNITSETDLKNAATAVASPENGATMGQEPRRAQVAQLPSPRK